MQVMQSGIFKEYTEIGVLYSGDLDLWLDTDLTGKIVDRL